MRALLKDWCRQKIAVAIASRLEMADYFKEAISH